MGCDCEAAEDGFFFAGAHLVFLFPDFWSVVRVVLCASVWVWGLGVSGFVACEGLGGWVIVCCIGYGEKGLDERERGRK